MSHIRRLVFSRTVCFRSSVVLTVRNHGREITGNFVEVHHLYSSASAQTSAVRMSVSGGTKGASRKSLISLIRLKIVVTRHRFWGSSVHIRRAGCSAGLTWQASNPASRAAQSNANKPTTNPTNQPSNPTKPTKQPSNQATNQPTNQTDQPMKLDFSLFIFVILGLFNAPLTT